MAQTNFNVGAIANDGTGDALRDAFIAQQAMNTDLYTNKVDKVVGKGLSENDFTTILKDKLDNLNANAEENIQADWLQDDDTADDYIKNKPDQLFASVGHFHYNDLATHTTPLVVLPSVPKKLTNDTLGVGTEKDFAPYGVADVWETTDNAFTFSPLDLGDQAKIRFDFLLSSTSPSQKFTLYVKFGVGSPSEYDMLVSSWVEKDVITYGQIIRELSFSIDNEDWLYNQAEIYILSDDDASVKVNGWYVPIIRKSVNVIDFNSDPLKLDKDITAGVERAYIINADGSQDTKATSDFKDVLEFAIFASFPTTGETGKIYVALDKNFTYRWTGSAYVQIGGTKKYQTLLFQVPVGTTLAADQKNYCQSRFNGQSVLGSLGLVFGNGIPESSGVLDLFYLSDVGVPNITPNYVSKVANVNLSYSRNVSESGANTNIVIRLMGETKYRADMQLIAEYNLVSSTAPGSGENKVEIPILTHLPLSAFSNLKWCIRTNNATAQAFNFIRLNIDIEEV